MSDPPINPAQKDSKDEDGNPNRTSPAQGLDLAEYTRDGKPLPLLTPSSLPCPSVLEQKAKETTAHPLHGLGVLDYYPKPKSIPRPPNLGEFPTPPPLPSSSEEWMFGPLDILLLRRMRGLGGLPEISNADRDFSRMVLQDLRRMQTDQRKKKRDSKKGVVNLRVEVPQELSNFTMEVSLMQSLCLLLTSLYVSAELFSFSNRMIMHPKPQEQLFGSHASNGDGTSEEKPKTGEQKEDSSVSSTSAERKSDDPVQSDPTDASKGSTANEKQKNAKHGNASKKKKRNKRKKRR